VPLRRSPTLAAALSFVLPGLGQLALGAIGRGVVVVTPAVVIAIVVGMAATQATDTDLAALVVEPTALRVLLVANVVLAAYHLAAILDAWRLGIRRSSRGRPGSVAKGALAVLIAATLGLHGYVEYVGIDTNATLDAIFLPGGEDDPGEGVIPPAMFDDDASAEPGGEASPPAPGSPTPGGGTPATGPSASVGPSVPAASGSGSATPAPTASVAPRHDTEPARAAVAPPVPAPIRKPAPSPVQPATVQA